MAQQIKIFSGSHTDDHLENDINTYLKKTSAKIRDLRVITKESELIVILMLEEKV
jgi:hypothetical protein